MFDFSLLSGLTPDKNQGVAASLGTPQISQPDLTPTKRNDTIFGLPVNNFTAVAGALGSAIGGNTGGGRISQVAAAIGNQQLKAIAAKNQMDEQMKLLKEIFTKGGSLDNLTPEQASALGLRPHLGFLGSGPSGSTGLESGLITPAKLGTSNSPSLL